MQSALIQNTKNDIDGHDSSSDKRRFVCERVLKSLCGSLKTGLDCRRHSNASLSGLDCINGLAYGNPRGEIEAQRHRREEALVINCERRHRAANLCQSVKRHLLARCRTHIEVFQSTLVDLESRIALKDNLELIELGKDGCDLPLTEGVVKRIVDGLWRNPQPRGGIAIDHDTRVRRRGLQIARDIAKFR